MSSRSESDDKGGQSVLDILDDWYQVPVLVLVVATMFAVRMQSYSKYVRNGEVVFSGNDAWYHYREVSYIVRHWPSPIPFDPWTGFPVGHWVGQFGTLYDQIVATIALVVGLGSPSQTLIAKTLLVAPAVFGALAAVPVYLIGKRIGGRFAGLFGAVVLMLLPGTFLQRTLVGVADHNAVEPFFMALGVFGFLAALGAARRSMPVWEVVREEFLQDRAVDTLESPLKWGLLGGFLVGLYLWVWPPGIILVGIVGVFLLVKVTSDVVNERTPEPTVFATATSMAVVAVMSLLALDTVGFETASLSLLQPVAAISVALAGVALAALARYWERESISISLFPVAVLGIVLLGTGVVSVLVPSVLSLIGRNLLRIVGFSAGAATRTIGEAQPFLAPDILQRYGVSEAGRITLEYGLTLFTGLVAAFWLHAKPLVRKGEQRELGYVVGSVVVIGAMFLVGGLLPAVAGVFGVDHQVFGLLVVAALVVGATMLVEYNAEDLFLVVWAAFVTSMAFTQVRFNYYLAVVVAVFNAYLLGQLLGWLDLRTSVKDTLDDVEGYQVLALTAVVLLVLGPALTVSIGVGSSRTSTAWQTSNASGPQGASLQWGGSLDWLQNNTPKEGTFAGADNRMEYYGSYTRTDDYAYPEGAYGVMSWWDYGHWITVRGKRIPNANPFQQGATNAANYLLAPNETGAQRVLDQRADQGEETRYVMVDYQMASTLSKFGAPVVFYDDSNVSSSDFYESLYRQTQQGGAQFGFHLYKDRYYESMMVRLYRYHGSAVDATPVVVDWETQTFTNRRTGEEIELPMLPSGNQSLVRSFDNMSAARQYVKEDGSAQVGGLGQFPTHDISALEHYRLVKASESTNSRYFLNELRAAKLTNPLLYQFIRGTYPATVKTFEKVPGATVHGTNAPANTTVTASVEMKMLGTNRTFVYKQHAQTDQNGEFTLTLPYSTTGYENFGPENGYTNVSVRATGPYTVTAPGSVNESGYTVQYGQNFSVSEARVNGVDDSTKTVELEKKVRAPKGAGNQTGNGTNTSALAGPSTLDDLRATGDAGDGASDGSLTGGDDATTGGDGAAATVGARAASAIRAPAARVEG